jgi:hypothetical protein
LDTRARLYRFYERSSANIIMVYHTTGILKLHRSSIYEKVEAVFGFNPTIMSVFNLVLRQLKHDYQNIHRPKNLRQKGSQGFITDL